MKTIDNMLIMYWEDFNESVSKLLKKIGDFRPDAIIGIRHGGERLALELHKHLNGSIYFTTIKHYNRTKRLSGVSVIDFPKPPISQNKVLIVDDLVDTGETVAEVIKRLRERDLKVAVLAKKPWSIIDPDYYLFETNKWVVFPWEEEFKEFEE